MGFIYEYDEKDIEEEMLYLTHLMYLLVSSLNESELNK